jgi:AraC-like DNA-binding protein
MEWFLMLLDGPFSRMTDIRQPRSVPAVMECPIAGGRINQTWTMARMLFDATTRRWARLLDTLPQDLRRVQRWLEPGPMPPERSTGHLHVVPTLVSCVQGVVRIEALDRRCDLQPGEALLIAPGIWHAHAPLRPHSLAFGLGFMAAWGDIVLFDTARTESGRIPVQPARLLMDRALACPDDAHRLATVRELLAHVLGDRVQPLPFGHPAMHRMVRVLWSRLHRGVTVEDLVHASGIGRSQAYAVFTTGYGVSPRQAIIGARRQLARSLLGAGLSQDEVARRCGLPDRGKLRRLLQEGAE